MFRGVWCHSTLWTDRHLSRRQWCGPCTSSTAVSDPIAMVQVYIADRPRQIAFKWWNLTVTELVRFSTVYSLLYLITLAWYTPDRDEMYRVAQNKIPQQKMCNFSAKDEWPPNSADLNSLGYHICGAMLQCYKTFQPKTNTIDELKKVLQSTWDDCHRTLSTRPYWTSSKNFELVWKLGLDSDVFFWFQYKHYDGNCDFHSLCFTW